MQEALSQAVAHRVINGGCKTPKRIAKQIKYLARIGLNFSSKDGAEEDSKPAVKLRLSARYGEAELKPKDIDRFSHSWALQSGIYQPGQSEADSKKELTTHFAVSFPPGTPLDAAEKAGLEWARILFYSGRFGAEWDYFTAFHTDREHPHTHIVVNRRAFPPENSHVSAMGKWLKIAHRYEPDETLAAEKGKEFGINYKILRDMQVEAAAKFGILLEATSRKERGLDSPSLTHGQYRQQQKIGLGEVNEHWGYIPEETFGDLLDENASGSSPHGSGAADQAGTQQSGGSSSGPVLPRDTAVDQRRSAAMRELGIQADEPMSEDVEMSREMAVDQPRWDEIVQKSDANETAEQAGTQQNAGTSSDPVLLQNTAVDPHRSHDAMLQRSAQIGEERDRSATEEPSLRKTPGGVELRNPAVDLDRGLAATQERRVQADKEHDRRVNEGPSRRKTPHHGVLDGLAESGRSKAKDDNIQEDGVAGRAAQQVKRRGNDPERIIETRAQKARQEQMEAEQSTASPHGMRLRNTPARQAQARSDRQGPVERNQAGNTRQGKQRGARGRRSNRRSSR
ncbi:relaxase/mobilization nuclease domain-containing protein [Agrobacterium sp. SHOUNA12C]|nr:relaxase/mobilization nuclease domain-containing protein [Agrobacterium sp. BETTINA12B]MCJ9755099.1 relaxase/mobilization nuclease domain-containing protein [Agrobacterium sp. SHOUNA12C]